MKVLLVAKPWRGGLARYVHAALEGLLPGSAQWLPTYPLSLTEKVSYRRDRSAWRHRLAQRVSRSNCDAAIFINHLPEFEQLERRDEYALWITDDPVPVVGRMLPYARVYISDPGYRDVGADILGKRFCGVLEFACLPSVHGPRDRVAGARGFCFIGNRDPKRDPYLHRLCLSGKDIRVYGNYFPLHPLCWRFPGRFRPPVSVDRMAAIYARHMASINIHAEVVKGGTNMRTFECAAYGIPQLVEFLPGLEALFTPGQDLLTFRNPEELSDQMARLEREPEFGQVLASSAARRVRARHTYFHRVKKLLNGVVDIPEHRVIRLAENGAAV